MWNPESIAGTLSGIVLAGALERMGPTLDAERPPVVPQTPEETAPPLIERPPTSGAAPVYREGNEQSFPVKVGEKPVEASVPVAEKPQPESTGAEQLQSAQDIKAKGRSKVASVILSGIEFGKNLSFSSLRKIAASHMQNLRGSVIRNEQTGDSILIDRNGAKESVSGKRSREQLAALAKIEEIIAKAKYIGSELDKKGHVQIKAWHTYETPIQVEDQDYTAVIKVRELDDGMRYYDSYLLKK